MAILHHVGGLEILVIDRVVLTHECVRRLVVKVAPLASHRLVRFGEECDRLASAVAASLAARDTPSRRLERTLGFSIPARVKDACPV